MMKRGHASPRDVYGGDEWHGNTTPARAIKRAPLGRWWLVLPAVLLVLLIASTRLGVERLHDMLEQLDSVIPHKAGDIGSGCIAWRATRFCTPLAPRDPPYDAGCHAQIMPNRAGYCECQGGVVLERPCTDGSEAFTCALRCRQGRAAVFGNASRGEALVTTANAASLPIERLQKPAVKVVYVLFAREQELEVVVAFLHSFERNVNSRVGYDYILFSGEGWSDFAKAAVIEVVSTAVMFAVVKESQWKYPRAASRRLNRLAKVTDPGRVRQERLQTRFMAGHFFNHPAAAEAAYVWALDHTSHFYCPLRYNPVNVMVARDAKYGYMLDVPHEPKYSPSMGQVYDTFLSLHPSLKPLWVDGTGPVELLCTMSAAAEIIATSWLRSTEYTRMFANFDATDGFVTEFWTVSAFRTYAAMTLPQSHPMRFDDITFGTTAMHNLDTSRHACPNSTAAMLPANKGGQCLDPRFAALIHRHSSF
eukprot:TRINITY_DN6193_c2_g1_i1.p1 TRINITY_DN6193_c2_g1~~TRINITY_DN6193_c2_g1_i1.p1  ORF type:complete len:477 (+),score=26.30 TRINITY_DN6193_c2_g1_i1:292-1722(+)